MSKSFLKFLIKINIYLILFSASVFALHFVLAYSPYNTHPALTEEMANFFNIKNQNKLSDQNIGWMMEGSINEDQAPRWINHFYDPIHNEGWKGKHFGNLSEEQGYKIGADVAPKEAITSLDWAINQEYQSAYGRQFGNQTWQKAIKSYIDGDKKSAFIALGHILHLIEDASVPDHTRNDTHADFYGDPGSPYEDYAKEYTNFNELTVAVDLVQENKDLLTFQSLAQAFDYLADYSNKNFFSEDTISNKEFVEPDLEKLRKNTKELGNEKIIFLYNSNTGYYIAFLDNKTKNYSVNDTKFILPSYRIHLFPQAVLIGASVIDLFFREAERYQNNEESIEVLSDQNESLLQTLKHTPKLAVLNIADFYDRNATKLEVVVIKTYQLAKNTIKNISLKIYPKIVLPESQLAIISPPKETIPISDTEQFLFPEEAPRGESSTLADLSELQITLDEAKARVAVLEKQVAEIAQIVQAQAQARAQSQSQAQAQVRQNNNLETKSPSAAKAANNFAALPYAGFGGGAAPSDAAPTENATNTSSSTSVELFV
ncbi:MAG: hypothetical protein AAB474_00310, partial [Patescibacteria group bacterium]